jgi:general secretion pathway protein H
MRYDIPLDFCAKLKLDTEMRIREIPLMRAFDSFASYIIKPCGVGFHVLQQSYASGGRIHKQPSKDQQHSATMLANVANICNEANRFTSQNCGSCDRFAQRCLKPGQHGFTLLELMVVIAIVALATVLVTLALPHDNNRALARDADRLAALLEAARAQSRAAGVPVTWRLTASGFAFNGLPADTDSGGVPWPDHWLDPNTQAALLTPGGAPLALGPDPVIGPQAVLLYQAGNDTPRLRIATDGLRPFAVENAP